MVQKSDFCHATQILVDDPILAHGMKVNFPPWERFFDFPFRSYSCFRKKIRRTCQKVFPLPTVGAPSARNSPSALSAGWIICKLSKHISSHLCWIYWWFRRQFMKLDIWFEKTKMHHGKLRPTRQNGEGSRSQDVEQGGGEQEPQVLCLSKMWLGATFNIVTDHQN